MRKIVIIVVTLLLSVMIWGCGEKHIPSDEIPVIKESIKALENVIIRRDYTLFDSILSPEASGENTTADHVFALIYRDGITSFTGFINKQIIYNNDAARVDCEANVGEGPPQAITITFKKDGDIWLLKKVEARTGEQAIPIMPDTTQAGDSL
ncbi:MAG: hypothetical protein KAR42_10100 [candidate division Zixibacteria bacterium]|nr:hypothetical protein [candidate division Zixibacteria bacterium]